MFGNKFEFFGVFFKKYVLIVFDSGKNLKLNAPIVWAVDFIINLFCHYHLLEVLKYSQTTHTVYILYIYICKFSANQKNCSCWQDVTL